MMQNSINEIVARLLRKKSLAATNLQQLEDLVKDFPYFSLSRYLLARKAMETDAANKAVLAEELALFVPNNYWLNYILTEDLQVDTKPAITTEGDHPDISVATPSVSADYPPTKESLTAQPLVAEDVIFDQLDTNSDPAPAKVNPVEQEETRQVDQESQEQISHMLSKIKLEASTFTETDRVPLDPYHRIDYFASQGIQLEKEPQQDDHVGRKLKKFTEWLKTMKRIPENESNADIDEHTNQNIQNLAARSLLGTEILTEAMAEVYTKQQLYKKAISLYKKLSLQNPAKSTYFASRIEELNKFV